MFLCTHGIHNHCDPGCFCAGVGYDIVEVLFPGADTPSVLWAFSSNFNAYDGPEDWGCDLCSDAVAAQVATAAGIRADDVSLIVLALTKALRPQQGEAPRTKSHFEMFRRLMRLRIGRAAEVATAAAAAAAAAADDVDSDETEAGLDHFGWDDDDENERDRAQQEEVDYAYGIDRGRSRHSSTEGNEAEAYVDPYAAVQLPVIYPGGYAQLATGLLPSAGSRQDGLPAQARR